MPLRCPVLISLSRRVVLMARRSRFAAGMELPLAHGPISAVSAPPRRALLPTPLAGCTFTSGAATARQSNTATGTAAVGTGGRTWRRLVTTLPVVLTPAHGPTLPAPANSPLVN